MNDAPAFFWEAKILSEWVVCSLKNGDVWLLSQVSSDRAPSAATCAESAVSASYVPVLTARLRAGMPLGVVRWSSAGRRRPLFARPFQGESVRVRPKCDPL
jgi:hypothetical protein